MKITFVLACLTIIAGIVIYIVRYREKRNLKKNMFIALCTGVIAIAILVYPLQKEYDNIFIKLFASFIYALRCSGMGQNLQLLSRINLNDANGFIYFTFMSLLFLAMPIVAGGFILTFLENILVKIRFALMKNKELHIFSEVNEKSLLIAKKLQNFSKAKIIFTGVVDKNKINIKSINTKQNITDLKLGKNKENITFYMFSENEDENINTTLEIIEKYKNRKNTKINILSNASEISTIIDSVNKGKISVEIINEKERAVFNLLNEKLLFLNCINNTISILIVGCGKLGKEFLKDVTWCSTMKGYRLEILVIDIKADSIKENINAEAPELLNNYDIKFINADIKSNKALDAIKSRTNINYVLVAMEEDDKNLNTAIMLRGLFLRECGREPIINLWVSNKYKKEQISNIVNEKNNSYNLNAFGNIEELYYNNNIVNSDLERLAIQIHLFYDPMDSNLERYNSLEYNKRSSRASALHIKYKIYSTIQNLYTTNMNENLRIFKEK